MTNSSTPEDKVIFLGWTSFSEVSSTQRGTSAGMITVQLSQSLGIQKIGLREDSTPTAIKTGNSDGDNWGTMKSLSAHTQAKHGYCSLCSHMQISTLVLNTKSVCVSVSVCVGGF